MCPGVRMCPHQYEKGLANLSAVCKQITGSTTRLDEIVFSLNVHEEINLIHVAS